MDADKANRWIPTLLPAALFALALGLQSPWVAIFYALLYGMANGMITIVKATAMATYVSRERAASLNGMLGLPTAIARAVAPSMLAALWVATGGVCRCSARSPCWRSWRSGLRSDGRWLKH